MSELMVLSFLLQFIIYSTKHWKTTCRTMNCHRYEVRFQIKHWKNRFILQTFASTVFCLYFLSCVYFLPTSYDWTCFFLCFLIKGQYFIISLTSVFSLILLLLEQRRLVGMTRNYIHVTHSKSKWSDKSIKYFFDYSKCLMWLRLLSLPSADVDFMSQLISGRNLFVRFVIQFILRA